MKPMWRVWNDPDVGQTRTFNNPSAWKQGSQPFSSVDRQMHQFVGPMVEAQATPAGLKTPEFAPEATLLVVDDDDNVRRALKRVLRRTRCRILDAPDAATA